MGRADAAASSVRQAGSTVTTGAHSDEQARRGRVLADLLVFAEELPHRWPGDRIEFPSKVWHS